MNSQGSTGTYVAATGPIDLPRPRRRKHRPTQNHSCPRCELPLAKKGAFHVCLDLTRPEAVVVKEPLKIKKSNRYRKARGEMTATELERARARDRARGQINTCVCGATISKGAKTCMKCSGLTKRKFTDAQEVEIAAAYIDGASAVGLGRLHGVTDTTIRDLLLRQGVQIRPKGSRVSAA